MVRLSAQAYLERVTSLVRKRALHSASVDWKATRQKTIEMTAEAKSSEDTYSAINYVLEQLADNHSFLVTRGGMRTKANNLLPQETAQARVASNNVLHENGKAFGFIFVSGFGGSSEKAAAANFASSLQKKILQASSDELSGWIVDLRGNTGGNMWPMLVGVGPLLGSGILGYFKYPNASIPWFYVNGSAGVTNLSGRHVNFRLAESIPDCPNLPVAVLIDSVTASSGEAVAISFKGRPRTVLIGSHTRGLSTNNETIKLSDGAKLYLTTSGEADRNKVLYDAGIAPDISITQGDVAYGDKADPGIRAAVKWLCEAAQLD